MHGRIIARRAARASGAAPAAARRTCPTGGRSGADADHDPRRRRVPRPQARAAPGRGTGRWAARPITGLTLFDLQAPAAAGGPLPGPLPGRRHGRPGPVASAIPPGTRVVVHLAAVVSAQAEADFDLGMRVNLHGTLAVLQACRALRGRRRGWCSPPPSPPSAAARRRGWRTMRARCPPTATARRRRSASCCCRMPPAGASWMPVSLRLPTVIVRPGRPNKAASSFVSAILREPLLGLETDPAGAGRFRGLDLLAAPRGGVVPACLRDGHRPARAGPRHQPAGAQRDRGRDADGAGDGGRAGSPGAGEARAGRGDRGDRRRLAGELHRRCGPGGCGFSEQESWRRSSRPSSRTTWRRPGRSGDCNRQGRGEGILPKPLIYFMSSEAALRIRAGQWITARPARRPAPRFPAGRRSGSHSAPPGRPRPCRDCRPRPSRSPGRAPGRPRS